MLEVSRGLHPHGALRRACRRSVIPRIRCATLIPVITVMGIAFALLMTGAVVVENVFAIKGLGRVMIQSILNRDYPVVQARS